jgi:RimJ/RimL family protein N-acetyltransferase
VPALTTERLRLVPITLDVIEAVLRGDRAAAEVACGARLPDEWPNADLVARAFPLSLDAIRADPETRLWGDSLVMPLDAPDRVLGSVVFHGRPSNGIAEVGYGIADGSRGQGLATEATLACVEWALEQDGIVAVRAITFPWHHASLGVIRKCGMQPIGSEPHDVFGEVLVFERKR